jgi:hypothetical protein
MLVGAFFTIAPVIVATSVVAQAQRPETQQQPAPRQMPQQRSAPQAQPQPGSPQSSPLQGQQNRAAGPTQRAVSAEFRTALEPHGRWQQHSRFGEVWVPANRDRNWRPYTVGRWVYNEDWGWYWAEDQQEADWGWATYHYGRWIEDTDVGWAWIPGDEWGPGFVQWRHGGNYVGWAPLPPEEIVVEYRDQPDVWSFVRTRDFVAAPRLAAVILPERDYPVFVRDTVVVNQTVILPGGRGFAVNPGIPATVIAAEIGRPIRAFDVRPRVLAGTAQIPGAIEVRAQDLRSGRFRAEATVRETRNEIRPTRRPTQLQPLAPGEQGRLGDNPPRAAQRIGQQEQQGRQPTQQQGRGKQEPAQTQGRGTDERRRQEQQGQQAPQQQQGQQPTQQRQQEGRGKQEPAQTQGRGAEERRQQQGRSSDEQRRDVQREGGRREQQRQGTEGRGDTRQPLTERGGGSQRIQSQPDRSGAQQRQPQPDRSGAREQRRDQSTTGTTGRGGGAAERPQQRGGPGATEGRGGGGGGRERGPAAGGGGAERGGGGPGPR